MVVFRLILHLAKLLHVASLFHLAALYCRWLLELPTSAKLTHCTSAVKLSLESLQCSLDVLALFYFYNNHKLL